MPPARGARDIVCDFNLERLTTLRKAKAAAGVHTSYQDGGARRLDKPADWLYDLVFSDG